jgi:hypothetical protein
MLVVAGGSGEPTRCEVELLVLWGVIRVFVVLLEDLDEVRGWEGGPRDLSKGFGRLLGTSMVTAGAKRKGKESPCVARRRAVVTRSPPLSIRGCR